MSKKDKSKFRKRLRAQILQDMSKDQVKEKTATPAPIVKTEIYTPQPKTIPAAQPQTNDNTYIDLPQIKKDLKKTAIVVGSFALVIAALAIVDSKTNALLSFGDFVFKVLHIQ